MDTAAAKTKTILDLEKDTVIVKAAYGRYSVWNWSDDNNISGQIEIIDWDKDKVVLKENILVVEKRSSEIKKFVGTRTYQHKED